MHKEPNEMLEVITKTVNAMTVDSVAVLLIVDGDDHVEMVLKASAKECILLAYRVLQSVIEVADLIAPEVGKSTRKVVMDMVLDLTTQSNALTGEVK